MRSKAAASWRHLCFISRLAATSYALCPASTLESFQTPPVQGSPGTRGSQGPPPRRVWTAPGELTLLSEKLWSWPLPTDPCWLSGLPLVLTWTNSTGQVLFRLRDLIVQKHVKRMKDVKWTMGRNLTESVWAPWFVHFIGRSNSTWETILLSGLTQLWLGHTSVFLK